MADLEKAKDVDAIGGSCGGSLNTCVDVSCHNFGCGYCGATGVGDRTGDGAGDCLSHGDRTAHKKGEQTVERDAESHWCASIFKFVVRYLV